MKNLTLIFISFSLVGCSTSSLLSVHSTPAQAEVSVRAIGSNDQIHLGKSPVRIKSTELRQKLKSDNPIEITISKEGYLSESVISTDYYSHNLNLELNLEIEPAIKDGKKVDQIVSGLFECHRLIKSKKTGEAQEKIKDLIKLYPHVSSLHEFQGSIYFILNEKEKAFDSFTLAVKYNDENQEAKRMLNILKQESKKQP